MSPKINRNRQLLLIKDEAFGVIKNEPTEQQSEKVSDDVSDYEEKPN